MRRKTKLPVLLISILLLIVIPINADAFVGFWSEQIQARIDLLGIITQSDIIHPFILANVFSLGLTSPVRSSLVMIEPYISLLISGAFYLDDPSGKLIGSGGGGVAIGTRMRLWGYLSVKPEISAMYLTGDVYKYALLEFASEFGVILPSTGPWSLTFDFVRIGVKPSAKSIPEVSLILSPSIGAIYKW